MLLLLKLLRLQSIMRDLRHNKSYALAKRISVDYSSNTICIRGVFEYKINTSAARPSVRARYHDLPVIEIWDGFSDVWKLRNWKQGFTKELIELLDEEVTALIKLYRHIAKTSLTDDQVTEQEIKEKIRATFEANHAKSHGKSNAHYDIVGDK